jgi:hypothetical protein
MLRSKHIRNIILLASATYLASCDQIGTPAPKTINGEWKCSETHYETGKSTYYISIDYTDSTKKSIQIFNFNNLSGSCSATVSGSNITIPKQTVDKHVIVGSGTISGDNKTLNFDYNDDPFGDGGGKVTTICTRNQ